MKHSHSFYNLLPKAKRGTPEIYFVGNSISPTYIDELNCSKARIYQSM